MIKTAIIGASGKFGQSVLQAHLKAKKLLISQLIGNSQIGKVDPLTHLIYEPILSLKKTDVILDVSSHTITKQLLDFALNHETPLVIGSTAHTNDELFLIKAASKKIPIFKAANFSLAVYLLKKLVKELKPFVSSGCYIDLIEKHRAAKKDAPSATALELAAILDMKTALSLDEFPRSQDTLQIHPIRGDDHCISHQLMISFEHEELHLSHMAFSRQGYADGVIRAVEFIKNQSPGYYGMEDLVEKNFR